MKDAICLIQVISLSHNLPTPQTGTEAQDFENKNRLIAHVEGKASDSGIKDSHASAKIEFSFAANRIGNVITCLDWSLAIIECGGIQECIKFVVPRVHSIDYI